MLFGKHRKPTEIKWPAESARLPYGFFRVRAVNGLESLAYRAEPIITTETDSRGRKVKRRTESAFGVAWPVGKVVIVFGKSVSLERSLNRLPVVRLIFPTKTEGLYRAHGKTLIDTEILFNAETRYEIADPCRFA